MDRKRKRGSASRFVVKTLGIHKTWLIKINVEFKALYNILKRDGWHLVFHTGKRDKVIDTIVFKHFHFSA